MSLYKETKKFTKELKAICVESIALSAAGVDIDEIVGRIAPRYMELLELTLRLTEEQARRLDQLDGKVTWLCNQVREDNF